MVNFTPNIPSSGQTLGGTRDDIRNNFTNYYDNMVKNHADVNSADRGKHKFLQMPDQAAAPATAVNEIGLYSKDVAGNSRLFLRQESNGPEVQISGLTPLSAASGYTFLPGGLIMQWGQATLGASKTLVITFPIAFTTVYQVIPAITQIDRMIAVTAQTNTNFTVQIELNAANGFLVRYMAIGV
jgi:hypothetical protein